MVQPTKTVLRSLSVSVAANPEPACSAMPQPHPFR